ncbi:hypothetical protein HCN44_005488 [Aphidius gifuensis]|uniref:Uncharacterized protein n=1 Tax=Aphidius gifuensis TaxID=684658 RepID=A0A834Y221_APHGI|nr:uncharacterized protein LOC122854196 [Aphidius gifuensis]KAF7997211.1 hypothetical protein HCN44_005488 [Aphidius gifuensis]
MSFNYEDPLGFTKRTASILDGLGAGEIVNEFKKRHISTDALGKLTKDDFIKLGASNELADSMYQQFNLKNQYRQLLDSNDDNRLKDLYDILKTGREHLHLISAFLTYANKRVRMSPNDFIVNQNKNERASKILAQATIATLHEIDQVEYHISQLLSQIRKADQKQRNVRAYLLTVGGLGLSLALLYRWRYY